jgi:hypothetical protein
MYAFSLSTASFRATKNVAQTKQWRRSLSISYIDVHVVVEQKSAYCTAMPAARVHRDKQICFSMPRIPFNNGA